MMAETTGGMVAGIASLEAVLRLSKFVPVLPCRRKAEQGFSNGRPAEYNAKSPLISNGFHGATQDEQQIRAWWKQWPDALVGVPTGQKTRLVAIDWDPDKHTDATGEWLQIHSESLIVAKVHGTIRGGRHYLYRVPAGLEYESGSDLTLGGAKRPGIDLRADGGYIIWWPIHGGTVANETAPPLPAGLIDERLKRKPATPAKVHSPVKWSDDKALVASALAFLDPSARDEWRNFGMAIHLASMGSDDGFELWHAWSSGGITGRMPDTYEGIDDCRYTWNSFKDSTAKPVTLGTLFHEAQKAGWRRPTPKRHEDPAPVVRDAQWLSKIMQTVVEPREWFFEEILPAGAFLIVGRPKVGKSWMLLQLAICAASCGDFLEFAALGRYGVLYITAEDDVARIQSRFNRFQLTEVPDGLRVMVGEELRQMADEFRGHMSFSQWLDAYLAKYREVKFVFIDTETTCRHVWEGENSGSKERSITRKDYAEVREFDSIALKHKVFVGLVNHTGKRRNGQWFDIHELINRTNTALAGASGSIVLADPPGHDPNSTDSRIRVLGIRGRDISGDHLIAVEQMNDGSFQSRGKWVNYVQTDAEQHVCDTLVEMNEAAPEQWITAKEVGSYIGKSIGTVQRTVTRMLAAGRTNYKGYRVETKKGKGMRLVRITE